MRYDLSVIASWIEPGARVLDLGCGNGTLLHHLKTERRARCTGIEADEQKVAECIAKGLSVLQGDINREILDYPDHAHDKGFDYVVLSQTLQQVYEPDTLLREMLRVGRYGIVSFPNFAHWKGRLQLLLGGRAPVTRELPYDWFDTPNIRVIPLRDFRRFCSLKGFHILKEVALHSDHHAEEGHLVHALPNWRAKYGIFLLGK
ncbi:MAG: methionine biosynthesis protein MetW [Desulfovibrionaceae bacterium]|jgi:methionine biosynthesis protein MetW|nr:methionine biosynthesis protein MetW [Desulfovibrionaceae bacterium]